MSLRLSDILRRLEVTWSSLGGSRPEVSHPLGDVFGQ